MAETLPFVEAFGPTIQGEGPAAGRLTSFVRFGGCNLSCSWCDSAYTWDAENYDLREEITQLAAEAILERIPDAPLLIVTGGEPLLNQKRAAFHRILAAVAARGTEIHVETNGTIVPNAEICAVVDQFSVSPKLPNAGDHKRSQDPALAAGWKLVHGTTEAHLKVVCETAADVARARGIADRHGWPPERVWVMPEGTDTATLDGRFRELADACLDHRVNLTHRLHVVAWGDERGR